MRPAADRNGRDDRGAECGPAAAPRGAAAGRIDRRVSLHPVNLAARTTAFAGFARFLTRFTFFALTFLCAFLCTIVLCTPATPEVTGGVAAGATIGCAG